MPEMNGVQTLHAMQSKPVFADRGLRLGPVYVCLSTDVDCISGLQREPFDLLYTTLTAPDIAKIKHTIRKRRTAALQA